MGRRQQLAKAVSVLTLLGAGCAAARAPLRTDLSVARTAAGGSLDQPARAPGFANRPGTRGSFALGTGPAPVANGPGGPATPVPAAPVIVLPPPDAVAPLLAPALPGEGEWQPAGRWVGGTPVVYVTTLRADGGPPNPVAGVAWIDTGLVRATLYSGSVSPGGGPWRYTAPIQPAEAQVLVGAFNGGFKLGDAHGGYYAEDRTIVPLVVGAASFVIYRDGSSALGAWGRDVTMTPDVVAVRQNLTLLVDGGQPVAGLSPGDAGVWGSTLGHVPHVYRSGLGIRPDGSLVYVAAPSLDVVQLAHLLVRAGAVRAMELDINPMWPTFATYAPARGQPAAPANGTDLLPTMAGGPGRFFTPTWGRDFITLTSREIDVGNRRQFVRNF